MKKCKLSTDLFSEVENWSLNDGFDLPADKAFGSFTAIYDPEVFDDILDIETLTEITLPNGIKIINKGTFHDHCFYEIPTSKWQAFKEKWFPRFLLKWFPIKRQMMMDVSFSGSDFEIVENI